jgi:hypothetical protein
MSVNLNPICWCNCCGKQDLDLSKTPEEREKPPPRYRRIYESHEVLLRADFRVHFFSFVHANNYYLI